MVFDLFKLVCILALWPFGAVFFGLGWVYEGLSRAFTNGRNSY